MWLGNLADLELHTSLAPAATPKEPNILAFDLDPGEPATIVECCRVGLWLQGMFERLGLECFAKTSRSEEHTSELQSRQYIVCRLLLEKKKRPHNHRHG